MQQKSYFFINQLLGHEGKGSLYQSLKQLNLVEELCTEELGGYKTILDLISLEITLTLEGMLRYQEVLQLVHEYLAKLIEWTAEDLAVFEESKQIAHLSFQNAYKVPDPWDNVTELATEILFSQDLTRILMETYSET